MRRYILKLMCLTFGKLFNFYETKTTTSWLPYIVRFFNTIFGSDSQIRSKEVRNIKLFVWTINTRPIRLSDRVFETEVASRRLQVYCRSDCQKARSVYFCRQTKHTFDSSPWFVSELHIWSDNSGVIEFRSLAQKSNVYNRIVGTRTIGREIWRKFCFNGSFSW